MTGLRRYNSYATLRRIGLGAAGACGSFTATAPASASTAATTGTPTDPQPVPTVARADRGSSSDGTDNGVATWVVYSAPEGVFQTII